MDELTRKGHEVYNIPFITTRSIPFSALPHADWIFFSSKNGVKHFFNQQPNIGLSLKFACLGVGTADELRTKVKKIDFIGNHPDTAQVGKEFAKIAKGQTVLFPVTKKSNRTIQKQFVDQQKVKDCIIYETIPISVKSIPNYDVIVFTSPSSVESFSSNQKFTNDKRHIAIGKSTFTSLENFGLKNAELSNGYSDIDLVNAVLNHK